MIELTVQFRLVGFFRFALELDQQGLKKLAGVVLLLKQERRPGAVKAFQEVKEQGSFAHPRLCDQHLKAEAAFDAVHQRSQRLAVGAGHEKESRVRRNTERIFTEPEVT